MDLNSKRMINKLLDGTDDLRDRKEIVTDIIRRENAKEITNKVLGMVGTLSAGLVIGYVLKSFLLVKYNKI